MIFGLIGLVEVFVLIPNAEAVPIRVYQESSAGAGDFYNNYLGVINPYNTTKTSANYYDYDYSNNASYNGNQHGGPTPISNTTLVFFVEASDGLWLFVVHEKHR
jgi:hypothetical protein